MQDESFNIEINRKVRKSAFKIVGIYYLVGLLWVILSSYFLFKSYEYNTFATNVFWFETIKGFLFVLITGMILYRLIQSKLKQIESSKLKYKLQEQRSKAILNSIPDQILFIDLDGLIVNSKIDFIFGKEFVNNSIVGQNYKSIFPEKVSEIISNELIKLSIDNKRHIFYFDVPLEKNKFNHYQIRLYLIDKNVYLIMISDISNEIKTERKIRALYTVMEVAPLTVLIIDKYGNIEYINQKFTEQFNYSYEEVLFTNFLDYIKQNNSESDFIELLTTNQNFSEVWHGSINILKKDGNTETYFITVTPVLNQNSLVEHRVIKFEKISLNQSSGFDYIHSYFDGITNLPNRQYFDEKLVLFLKNPIKEKSNGAVIILNLREFSTVNENYGYERGNQILKMFAQKLKNLVGPQNLVARSVGDEFFILYKGIDTNEKIIDSVESIIERILKPPYMIEEVEVYLSASIGIVKIFEHGSDAATLLNNADSALRVARKKERNYYQFFSWDIEKKVKDRFKIELGLRRAIINDEIEVFYQPKYSVKNNKIVGSEALVRWKNSDQQYISPNDFIPIAEETGLILEIGERVLYHACRQTKIWNDLYNNELQISVNLSLHQFKQRNISSLILNCLKKTELNPKLLDLEITESTLMNDIDYTVSTLEQLQSLGVRISIDDFGTGYSSLSYLTILPLNTLKIDQSFIRSMITGTKERAVISATINLGHNLNLNVIAEGVETVEQYFLLKEWGCDEIQGFFLSKPVPPDEFELRLKRNIKK